MDVIGSNPVGPTLCIRIITMTSQIIVVKPPKSLLVSYLLWFFFGQIGAHRFYLRSTGLGVFYILLSFVGWATAWFFIGYAFLGVLWIFLILDLFLIPGRVRMINSGVVGQATQNFSHFATSYPAPPSAPDLSQDQTPPPPAPPAA